MALINKYHPKNCKVRPWDDIEDSFSRWFGEQHKNNIAELVRHIKNSGLSNRLYGLTSMNKLVIGIYDPIEWDRETLHVTFDITKNEWHFVYYSVPFQPAEFIRTYSFDKGIEKFDSFIKMIGW
jgi:hypothetical protein